ncbi:hypothetical protein ACFV4K_00335 [Nocardia sp. NPDC059764]|uniref:hypothetical protein n=1 Tax=Nocardia sp. NPDC059764 TaxID=3346939 RepID=UPI003661EA17
MALLLQMVARIQRAAADGSVKLSRAEYKQFAAEIHDAQKLLNHEIGTTRAWYQARTEEYQRESSAAFARAAEGVSAEKQAQAGAYLAGLRASIENTIHNTVLTVEERGQVVQALNAIETAPGKPVPHSVFRPVSGTAAARARFAAAASAHKVAEHQHTLAATTDEAAARTADTTDRQRETTRRFEDLSGRLERLETRVAELIPEPAATVASATTRNGRPRATQQARHHSASFTTAQQRPHAGGTATGHQAEGVPATGWPNGDPQVDPWKPSYRPHTTAEAAAEFIAEMEAEA